MRNDQCMDINLVACFFCGEDNGIAIGKKLVSCENKYDTKHIFGGYEPCDKCKVKFSEGFLIIECQETPISEGQPEMQNGVYPTGAHWVVKNESAKELFTKEIAEGGKVFVDKEFAKKIGLYNQGETNE